MAKDIFTALGLMSGTSMDGVDAALVRTDGESLVEPLAAMSFPYNRMMRCLLTQAMKEAQGLTDRTARPGILKEAEDAVTRAHISAVEAFRREHADIDLIGFHGQTVLHRPEARLTVQIGDGAALARETGVTTVWDMRAEDVSQGGHGAPLIPVYHRALAAGIGKVLGEGDWLDDKTGASQNPSFPRKRESRANINKLNHLRIRALDPRLRGDDVENGSWTPVRLRGDDEKKASHTLQTAPAAPLVFVNIGGISNVTWVGRGGRMLAFDAGPGNALLDDWLMEHTGKPYDEDGELAASGEADEAILSRYLASPFFAARPPKSLDRGDFPIAPVRALTPADGAATLTELTARAIARAAEWFPQAPKLWIVTGGGRLNRHLMTRIAANVEAPVAPAEALKLDGDMMEAQGWAYLAVRCLKGLPITFPETTGAPRPLSGGVVSPGRVDEMNKRGIFRDV